MSLVLAPMEGLLDFVLRDVLTRVGGVDRCVSEFIRITHTLLPGRNMLLFGTSPTKNAPYQRATGYRNVRLLLRRAPGLL